MTIYINALLVLKCTCLVPKKVRVYVDTKRVQEFFCSQD